jgi:hypothetical protein
MSKKTLISIILILIVLIILDSLAFLIDINRIIENKEPLFSVQKSIYEDENTVEYMGAGYKIFKTIIDDKSKNIINFGSIFSTYEDVMGDEVND